MTNWWLVIFLAIRSTPSYLRNQHTEAATAWVVMFFMLLFAMWTLAHHAATFGGIPWQMLSLGWAIASLPVMLLAAWGAQRFSLAYTQQVESTPTPTGLQSNLPVALFVASTMLLLATQTYDLRFGIALMGFVSIWWSTQRQRSLLSQAREMLSPTVTTPTRATGGTSWLLGAFALLALAVTLTAHRPDADDSSFIQIAAQTLHYPERAPLTFDASLGTISEPFRFAPYRLASYETLVALLAEWTGLDLLAVYYLLLPGLTAALTVAVAFLFMRWFLPSRAAIVGVGIFLLITLAWGETHTAYGNRLFVRLFQGKGLLIALTTPMTLIAGLMLLRHRSFCNWIFLALAQVATLGVSSSGLVCLFMTAALILAAAMRHPMRVFALTSGIVATTLIYPAVLGAWLKFGGASAVALSEVGTYFPINASLGLSTREALALAILPLGIAALGPGLWRCEYTLLSAASIALVFNPWLSQLLSELSSRNMSWRLAWAAPLPLLMALGLGATISPMRFRKSQARITISASAATGIITVTLFLVAARWTLATSNGVTWQWPSPKVPAHFDAAREIVADLKATQSHGTILASRDIGTWLPLLAPEMRQVMPGHTYPIMLQTILPPSEFTDRTQLLDAINGRKADVRRTLELIKHYSVTTLVMPEDSHAEKVITEAVNAEPSAQITRTKVVSGYQIVTLKLGSDSE